MAWFFSFCTYNNKYYYFSNEHRRTILVGRSGNPYLPDSHSSICEYFAIPEDKTNKYEFNNNNLLCTQMNNIDDSKEAEVWINEFITSRKFYRICEELLEVNEFEFKRVPLNIQTMIVNGFNNVARD